MTELICNQCDAVFDTQLLLLRHKLLPCIIKKITKDSTEYIASDAVYIMNAINTKYYKVGFSNDVKARLKGIQTAHYEKIYLYDIFYCQHANKIEKLTHKKFSDNRVRGEWFFFDKETLHSCSKFITDTIQEKNCEPYDITINKNELDDNVIQLYLESDIFKTSLTDNNNIHDKYNTFVNYIDNMIDIEYTTRNNLNDFLINEMKTFIQNNYTAKRFNKIIMDKYATILSNKLNDFISKNFVITGLSKHVISQEDLLTLFNDQCNSELSLASLLLVAKNIAKKRGFHYSQNNKYAENKFGTFIGLQVIDANSVPLNPNINKVLIKEKVDEDNRLLIKKFIDEYCDVEVHYFVFHKDLYKQFNKISKYPTNEKQFTQMMVSSGFVTKKKKNGNGFLGLMLKNTE